MNHKRLAWIAVAIAACSPLVRAGVPQPDVILWGQVLINSQPVTRLDSVTIIARVDGVPDPVGMYRMGQSSTAEDNYVLRVRLQAPVAGSAVDDNAAQVGQTVHLRLRIGDGPEEAIQDYVIPGIGILQNLTLSVAVLVGNCNDVDLAIDLADHALFRACFAGPNLPVSPSCSCADTDGDEDVDLRDWRGVQNAFTGSIP